MLKNNKGFSLIELMVVVAIIAILSTIAIPSYQSFQARARQKEGFALLSAYYTAAQATAAEHGWFPGNFVQTGFAPTGQLGYRVTAADGQDLPYGSNDNACIVTSAACAVGTFKTWAERPLAAAGAIGPAAPAGCAGAVTNATFTVVASGRVSTKSTAVDTYSMNQLKALTMCTDGLN